MRRLREERDCLSISAGRGEAALIERAELDAVDREVAALIDEAVDAARAGTPPDASALLTDVYVRY